MSETPLNRPRFRNHFTRVQNSRVVSFLYQGRVSYQLLRLTQVTGSRSGSHLVMPKISWTLNPGFRSAGGRGMGTSVIGISIPMEKMPRSRFALMRRYFSGTGVPGSQAICVPP